MEGIKMKRWMTTALVMTIFLSVPMNGPAQMMGGGAEKKGMMGMEMPMPPMMEMQGMMGMHGMGMEMDRGRMGMMRMMGAVSQLDLTPEQKKKLQLLKLQHQKEAIPLLSKVHLAGVELDELALADPPDLKKMEAKVREKHDALIKLEISHLALAQQVKGLLTPEQRQKMESMMMMGMGPMPMMMGSPAGKVPTEKPSQGQAEKGPEGSSDKADPHGH
jgi:Spy/CpxP family protein refolding chaperone